MGYGKELNKSEIDQIILLRSEKYKISKISKLLNRSRCVVYNVLKNPKVYGKTKRSENKFKKRTSYFMKKQTQLKQQPSLME